MLASISLLALGAALHAPSLRLPTTAAARAPAAVCSLAESLRSTLSEVRAASPLSAGEAAEVRMLCAEISAAAGVGATSPEGKKYTYLSVPKMSDATKADLESALAQLFKAYDQNNDGYVTLVKMLESNAGIYAADGQTGNMWEARQAKVGARVYRRLFAEFEDTCEVDGTCGKITKPQYIEVMLKEFARRIERGLSYTTAISEVKANLPRNVIMAEAYGFE